MIFILIFIFLGYLNASPYITVGAKNEFGIPLNTKDVEGYLYNLGSRQYLTKAHERAEGYTWIVGAPRLEDALKLKIHQARYKGSIYNLLLAEDPNMKTDRYLSQIHRYDTVQSFSGYPSLEAVQEDEWKHSHVRLSSKTHKPSHWFVFSAARAYSKGYVAFRIHTQGKCLTMDSYRHLFVAQCIRGSDYGHANQLFLWIPAELDTESGRYIRSASVKLKTKQYHPQGIMSTEEKISIPGRKPMEYPPYYDESPQAEYKEIYTQETPFPLSGMPEDPAARYDSPDRYEPYGDEYMNDEYAQENTPYPRSMSNPRRVSRMPISPVFL